MGILQCNQWEFIQPKKMERNCDRNGLLFGL